MRAFLVTLLLFFCTARAYAEDDPNYLYAVTFPNGFAATRYAKPEYAESLRKGRSDCVLVSWAYAPEDQNNVDDLKLERDRASDAVAAELNERREAVSPVVTIGGFTRVWIIYTSAGQELAQGLESRLRDLRHSKINVRFVSDSEWTIYANYVKQLHEKK